MDGEPEGRLPRTRFGMGVHKTGRIFNLYGLQPAADSEPGDVYTGSGCAVRDLRCRWPDGLQGDAAARLFAG